MYVVSLSLSLSLLSPLCRRLIDCLQSLLPSSLERINRHINQTYLCIHEASQKSPAWTAYLQQVDSVILSGLKNMLLTIISTLVQKATRYEQGDPILPLVMVQLELQGDNIQFSPPLSGHSALSSVPEMVQNWMNDYVSLAKFVRRVNPVQDAQELVGELREDEVSKRDGEDKTYFKAFSSDSDIKSAVGKICAHLETNSRQCQVMSVCMFCLNLLPVFPLEHIFRLGKMFELLHTSHAVFFILMQESYLRVHTYF